MRILNRVILAALILAGVASTIVFILQNQQPISLNFLSWSAPQLSVAVPVIIALLIGMLIGPLLGWSIHLVKKR